MSKKTVIKSTTYACSKCNRDVTFRFFEIQFFANELEDPIGRSLDKIIDHGQCGVAQTAAIPHHPLHDEMTSCPFYQELN